MNALIQNGVNINLVDGDEQTALHIAAANGKMFFFQQDFQAYFFSNIPIFVCIDSGNEKIVRLLLRYGAKVNSVDNYGWHALMMAAENGIHSSS